ncbi:MAG: TspO/MBR family protein [Fimbriimonadaceae bacterium]
MPSGERVVQQNRGFLGYLGALSVISLIGYLGLRRGLAGWYGGLLHPKAALAGWAFGPIWAVLCLLLGYISWRLWTADESRVRCWALGLFGTQILLHSTWLWLLFGFQRPVGALAVLGGLGIVAIPSFVAGRRVRPVTAVLITPFLIWLGYAAVLNYGLWALNYRDSGGVGHIETTSAPN